MADDTANRGSQDRIRVNVHEEHEVRYWTSKFGCSPQPLVAAVNAVGVMAVDVQRHLEDNWPLQT